MVEPSPSGPPVTICVLTYGNYLQLARRCIESITTNCERASYRLVVGANVPSREALNYLWDHRTNGVIDRLIVSPTNINKCPMMRRMFDQVESEFLWWFDDDSYITDAKALPSRLEIVRSAKSSVVMWGHKYFVNHEKSFSRGQDVVGFIKSAAWYRGKPPPSWEPGGRGEFNFKGKGTGDGRWFFMTGGSWLIRTSAVRELDWPDPRLIKCADDVFLSEAIRQQGWDDKSIGPMHVAINTELRRGEGEDQNTMARQCIATLSQTTKAKNTGAVAGQQK